jgi:hypothetical protein
MRWWPIPFAVFHLRRSLPEVARAPEARPSVQLPLRGLDTDGPAFLRRNSAYREIATRVHQAGSVGGEQGGSAVDGIALADTAQVEADTRLKSDERRTDVHPPARRG